MAGSEQVGKTAAAGKTLSEARNINKSLTALGKVVSALVEDQSHIPYRDSKLTRLLQSALSSHGKLSLITTASIQPSHSLETLSTCRFGTRAKYLSFSSAPRVNREHTGADYKMMFFKAKAESQNLRRSIRSLKRENGHLKTLQEGSAKKIESLSTVEKELKSAEKLKITNLKLQRAIAALRNRQLPPMQQNPTPEPASTEDSKKKPTKPPSDRVRPNPRRPRMPAPTTTVAA